MTYGANFALGENLPHSPHSVSVSMPDFQNVIDYEENLPSIMNALKSGYPRFVFNPEVQKLQQKILNTYGKKGELLLCLPSKSVALRGQDYLKRQAAVSSRIVSLEEVSVFALFFPEAALAVAKSYWQHFGEIISSRMALHINTQRPLLKSGDAKDLLIKRIAFLYQAPKNYVFLFPTGMAAFACAHRACLELKPNLKTLQFGFPYVDNLKLQEKAGSAHFLAKGSIEDILELNNILSKEQLSGVFCEVPGNPLLKTPNLKKLRQLLKTKNTPFVIDDTISGPLNTKCLEHCDIVITSLTKYFSGSGEVMGGALIINNNSTIAESLKLIIEKSFEDLLWEEDAVVLEETSRDYTERLKKVNITTAALCEKLSQHQKVEKIYYPLFEENQNYNEIKLETGGYGGLFSLQVKGGIDAAKRFYNNIEIAKGPTFGTNFTVCCPYTYLAHYKELTWAEEQGIPSELIRCSIGLEEIDELIKIFSSALNMI